MKDSEAVKRLCDVYDDKYERALKESEGKAVLRELCATLHSVAPIQARSVLPYGVAILFYPIRQENCSCSGESFGDLAKELSEDTTTLENGDGIPRWIERNSQGIPEPGEAAGIIDLVFSTEAGSIVEQPMTSDKGAHIVNVLKHEQESQKTFEDVKQAVYTTLRSQKEQDIQQQLFENLKKTDDVVIHQSAFAPEKSDEINEGADN